MCHGLSDCGCVPCRGTRYLYEGAGEVELQWETRRQLLLQELREAKADVSTALAALSGFV